MADQVTELVPSAEAVERWLTARGWKLHSDCTTVTTWCSPTEPQRWISVARDSAPALREWHLRTVCGVHRLVEPVVLAEMIAGEMAGAS